MSYFVLIIIRLLQRFGISNLIHEPTNLTIPNGSCIDLIIANNTGIVSDSSVNPPCCSTHSITGVEVKFHIMKQYAYQRVIRDYNNDNYVGLNNDLTAATN